MKKNITKNRKTIKEGRFTKVLPRNRQVIVGGIPAPKCHAEVKTYGNIWIRRLKFKKKGESKAGHKHAFDHLHFLAKGRIQIKVYNKQNKEQVIFQKEYIAPYWIKVPKEHFHDIVALEDDTEGYCIQALHNDKGNVVATDYEHDDDWIKEVEEFEQKHGRMDETQR